VVVPPEPLPQEPTPVEPELAEPVMAARTAASIPSSASNANSATTAEPTREAVAGTVGDPPELAGPIAGTVLPGPVQIPLRAPKPSETPDPSDYAVHDGRVTVQAAETLGHYADWLEVRASTLRAKNGMRYEQPLVIGRSMRLDFRVVTPEEFERRRLEYHRTLQSEFFSAFEVTGTERHVLRRGESLWYLAERKYRIPIWLLRQYNPELDFASLPAGAALVVPVVEPRAG
jgi:membrane-bound lytic murein transglycosylase D